MILALDRGGLVGEDGADPPRDLRPLLPAQPAQHGRHGPARRKRAAANDADGASSTTARSRFGTRGERPSGCRSIPPITPVPIGKAKVLKEGGDVVILAVGASRDRKRSRRTRFWRSRGSRRRSSTAAS
ncbi:MAG: hypothetical protein MZV70_67870 [Desulfobacterales bacterium]|nr:hypothetical protein [Desulfobacterales bacterium]